MKPYVVRGPVQLELTKELQLGGGATDPTLRVSVALRHRGGPALMARIGIEWDPTEKKWKGDVPGATWRRTEASELWAVDGSPQGLLGVFSGTAGPDRRHLDSTIASMSLGQEVKLDGEWTASWRGTLLAPADGSYLFAFRTHGGTVEMRVDGKPLWSTRGDEEKIERGPSVTLQKGPHEVAILYRVVHGPAAIDWIWTPPGQRESLVPPAALRPPADAGPGPPLSEQTLVALRSYRHSSDWVTVP